MLSVHACCLKLIFQILPHVIHFKGGVGIFCGNNYVIDNTYQKKFPYNNNPHLECFSRRYKMYTNTLTKTECWNTSSSKATALNEWMTISPTI